MALDGIKITWQHFDTLFARSAIGIDLVDVACPHIDNPPILFCSVAQMFPRIRSRSGYVACAIASSVSLVDDF